MHESTSEIEREFLDALMLLHSNERNSAEKLRRMLDACIERKHGPEKTLVTRMPERFLRNTDESESSSVESSKRDSHVVQESMIHTDIWDGDPEIISLLETDEPKNIANYWTSNVQVYEVDYENCKGGKDIPRISIPNEGFADGTVCKVFFN